MKKEMNNKGFSLVELIIVIAIMAVLVGVLAPQYLKYVQRSKVSTDITNAEAIATAINTSVSDGVTTFGTNLVTATAVAGGAAVSNLDGFTTMPTSRVNTSYQWVVTWNATDGVTSITLGGSAIYPDAAEYHTAND